MKPLIKTLCLVVIAVGFINFFTFIAAEQLAVEGLHKIQGGSLFITHPLMMAAMFYLLFGDVFSKMLFRGDTPERDKKVEELLASGSAQASFHCAGRIGSLNFSGPLLKVTVSSQGIHCKPILMPAFAILSREIKDVKVRKSLLQKGVEFSHTSSEIASPIFLLCGNDQTTISALISLQT